MKKQLPVRITSGLAALMLAACVTQPAPKVAHLDGVALEHRFDGELSRVALTENYTFSETYLPRLQANYDAQEEPQHHETQHTPPNTQTSPHAKTVQGYTDGSSAGLLFDINTDLPQGWELSSNSRILRHRESGLECVLSYSFGAENVRYLLTDLKQFDDVGRDVGCNYQEDSGKALITLFATYRPDLTLEQMAAASVASIRAVFNVKGVLSVPLPTIRSKEPDPLIDGLEKQLAGAFDVGEIKGVPYKTAIWIAKTGGWHVKVRATYPQADTMSEIMAAISFTTSHLVVRAKNLKEPIGNGVSV